MIDLGFFDRFNGYHYHIGKTDVPKLLELMKDTKEVEVRIRYEK